MKEQFALKFLSGKYQGGEFPIPEGQELVVGRASEFDMVLVEDMVSRKHAIIQVSQGVLTIEDLGSTNGTFVNGERLEKTAELSVGDRILIGTSILKVVSTSGDKANTAPSQQLPENPVNDKDELSGLLEDARVPDLLALLNSAKKTGRLALNTGKVLGDIYVRDGNVFFATYQNRDDMGPHKALSRVIGWQSGTYRFVPLDPDVDFLFELEEPITQLVSTAQSTFDKFQLLSDKLPDSSCDLTISKPLEANLSELSTSELDIFQLIYNHGKLDPVLDQAITNDPGTAEIIIKLIQKEYVIAF
ncbi:MAG: FHA domain-containing protein [Myxococcota bacterium]|nr:FHA domain-containing protein [Myxococcota bacterium]